MIKVWCLLVWWNFSTKVQETSLSSNIVKKFYSLHSISLLVMVFEVIFWLIYPTKTKLTYYYSEQIFFLVSKVQNMVSKNRFLVCFYILDIENMPKGNNRN